MLKLQINRDVDLSGEGASYSDGSSTITVTSVDGVVDGLSFLSYATVGCILAEKGDCDESYYSEPASGVVDSVVLGASLYEDVGAGANSTRGKLYRLLRQAEEEDVSVELIFYYDLDTEEYSLSSELNTRTHRLRWPPADLATDALRRDLRLLERDHFLLVPRGLRAGLLRPAEGHLPVRPPHQLRRPHGRQREPRGKREKREREREREKKTQKLD